jgi:hypothetical protein
MTPTELRLFAGLVGALAERFSASGHILQQNHRESRGHCPVTGCGLRCSTDAALFIEATEILEEELREPEQVGLFDAGDDAAVAG